MTRDEGNLRSTGLMGVFQQAARPQTGGDRDEGDHPSINLGSRTGRYYPPGHRGHWECCNSALAGGGGVDGAIHRAGGPSIMSELKAKYKGCPTGSAVMTGAEISRPNM